METKRTRTEPETIVTTLRIPRDMHAKLHDHARRQQRTVSGQVRYVLERYFKEEPEEIAA